MFKQSDYYTKNKDGTMNCNICPRNCKLAKDGARGYCFVRGRKGDKVGLLTYGKLSAVEIDPIEKKPLYHFLPNTKVYSFGTIGCNMGCLFCQNWHMSRSTNEDDMTIEMTPDEVVKEAIKNDCKSVAYTYNEPTIFFEYARDCAIKCREKDLKNIAVTAGYINPKPRKEFYSLMDATNIDLKGFSEDYYKRIVGTTLKPVLETIEYVKNKTNCWLEITNLVIPTENDSDKMIKDMCKWIKKYVGTDTPLHFSAFYPCYKMMDYERTPVATLKRAYDIAKSEGLQYVYLGNVNEKETSTTYCGKCGESLINRDYYDIAINKLKSGQCKSCKTKVAGVF